ncbi:MAG TPA: hypothetical protein VNZ53_47385 [Steroidobacteraceae bacterium]|jgi:hypothetical protein|nr:hypothetical protein [Steroidobacteraceae bacterium]
MTGSPSIVPETAERDVYLVLDDFGDLGRAWPETAEEDTARSIVIRHLMEGQYGSPVRVVAFNTVAGWSRDVTEEIARELWKRCGDQGEVPRSLLAFLDHHGR